MASSDRQPPPEEVDPTAFVEEARRLVDAAQTQGALLRLLGGVAVLFRCPSARHHRLAREYGDIDFVAYASQRRTVATVLEDLGYIPDRRFNAVQGHRRLLFENPEMYKVDVFLDVFPMCHTLDFTGRLEKEDYTIPLADLLLSKLQIVEKNEKDVRDILALILDHAVVEDDDRAGIALERLKAVTSTDWGWYKTATITLDSIDEFAEGYLEPADARVVKERLSRIRAALEQAPKSRRWRLRDKVGEKMRWYVLPEEVDR
jgi:hypothetical protein